MSDTHLTAPTRFIEIGCDRFDYRRWGNSTSDQPPLFLLQHFRGGMDHWPPFATKTWSSAVTLSRCCGSRGSRTTCRLGNTQQSFAGSDQFFLL